MVNRLNQSHAQYLSSSLGSITPAEISMRASAPHRRAAMDVSEKPAN